MTNHLSEMAETIHRILEVFDTDDAAEQDDVVWVDDTSLAVAPLSVADLLRDNLFGENTVVLTSATLALGGRFDVMAAQWGMPKGSWDSMDAGTPFNPAKSGILYVASHLPAPGRDGLADETLEEMKELIMAAGGRTLGLFSSRRAAEQAAEKLRMQVPFEIFVQGQDTTGALVEKFTKHENSCLFGTLTLWQGVDVPGPACSLVLIDRIPFPAQTSLCCKPAPMPRTLLAAVDSWKFPPPTLHCSWPRAPAVYCAQPQTAVWLLCWTTDWRPSATADS